MQIIQSFAISYLVVSMLFWLYLVYEQFILKRVDSKVGGPISTTWPFHVWLSIGYPIIMISFVVMWIVTSFKEEK